MKTLILAAVAAFAVLATLPVVSAQEVETISAAVFPKGKTFTLTVRRVVSSKGKDGVFTPSGVPIPAGIPKYKVGQKITFTIGRDGRLPWPDRVVPFLDHFDRKVFYGSMSTEENPFSDNATIGINSRKRPIWGDLHLYQIKKSGVVHTVIYELR